jgi:2-methylcitrate dehydratase PrpD
VHSEITERLATHIYQTRFEDIPHDAIARAQLAILDVIAVAIAASGSDIVEKTRRVATGWAGRPDSRVLVFGDRLPAHHAAFVNAVMARVLDFDDTYELAPNGAHASAYIVPVAMALADRDPEISGKEFLSAVVIASDLYCRLSRSILANAVDTGRDNGVSVFGTYACAARLLRLNPEELLNGFGIAYSQSAGEFQMYEESADSVSIQQGLRARSGIDSAELAQAGLTGPHEAFLGRYGYFRAFEPVHDVNLLISDLGKDFVSRQLSYKPFPCCRCMHQAISAMLALREKSSINPERIRSIRVGTNRMCADFLAKPPEQKWNPKTPMAAKFSLPYGVAVAAAKGNVGLTDFDQKSLSNPEVRRLMESTKVEVLPDIEKIHNKSPNAPAQVLLRMSDGEELSYRVEYPFGHPLNFPDRSHIENKFRHCAYRSARVFSDQRLAAISAQIRDLAAVSQASRLLDLMTTVE